MNLVYEFTLSLDVNPFFAPCRNNTSPGEKSGITQSQPVRGSTHDHRMISR